MNALSTRKSAKNHGTILAIVALIAIIPMALPLPKVVHAQVQTNGQTALVFQIKNPGALTQTQTNLAFDQVMSQDPLTKDLKTYLQSKNSPFADYTEDLLKCSDWKRVLAISFVESNMGIHHYSYNSSGIGGQQYLRKYSSYSEWMDDMCNLLTTRYSGWSIEKMDGVYVQPFSYNWKLGANKILGQLDQLEAQANQERAVALGLNPQLALAPTQTVPQN